MGKFSKALANIINNKTEDIFQGVCAVVEKFDGKKMLADVTIDLRELDVDGSEVDMGTIPDVAVGFINGGGGYYIRPFYKKGDLVWVTFSSYQISNSLKGKKLLKSIENTFDITYAMVSHGLFKETDVTPTPWLQDGLIIGFGNNTFIRVQDDDLFMQTGLNHDYHLDSTGKHSWNNGEVTLDP